MDSERQSLLEQKRQRLQELKRRRLLGSPTQEISPQEVDAILESPPKLDTPILLRRVDVAIQTDAIDAGNVVAVLGTKAERAGDLEEIQCNQAVQTLESYFDREDVREAERTIATDAANAVTMNLLDDQIEESNRALENLYEEEPQEATVFDEFEHSFTVNGTHTEIEDFEPFKLVARIENSNTTARAIADIDLSTRFPGLVVVAYASAGSTHQLNGLAKILNLNKSPPVIEFLLECNTSISTIRFDCYNGKRILGGLADGRIVIWDLTDRTNRQGNAAEYIVLPSISSPLPNANEPNSSAHNSGISSLTQISIENNESIVASTYSGTLSLWSSNMLATPKCAPVSLKSLRTDESGNSQSENIGIEGVVALKGDFALREASFAIDQHKFLSNFIALSPKGELYHLGNDMELIKSVYLSNNTDPSRSTLPTTLSVFLEGKYFMTAHLDSTLKLWSFNEPHPILDIPTRDLIIGVAVRPHSEFQFVTLALSQTPIVQFWDLKIRLRSHVVDFTIAEGSSPTKIAFDCDGKKLVLGFLDGSVSVYEIDEPVLKEISRLKRNSDLDPGLQDID